MHAGSNPTARETALPRRARQSNFLFWQQAKHHGLDVSLLAANLHKTPAERLRQHGRALATVQALRDGLSKRHG